MKNSKEKMIVLDDFIYGILKSEGETFYRKARKRADSGDFSGAIELHLQAAKTFERIGLTAWAARSYGRVAWAHLALKDIETAKKFLEYSVGLDKNQAAANYLWAAENCLRMGDEGNARIFFAEFIKIVGEETEVKKMISATKNSEFLGAYRRISASFFGRLVEEEKQADWPPWAMSDEARLYAFRAELEPERSMDFFLKASEIYEKTDLSSHAIYTKAKYYIELAAESDDLNSKLRELDAALQCLDKVRLRPGGSRDLSKALSLTINAYKEIVLARKELSREHLSAARSFVENVKNVLDYNEGAPLVSILTETCNALDRAIRAVGAEQWEDYLGSAEGMLKEASRSLPIFEFFALRKLLEREIDVMRIFVRDKIPMKIRKKEKIWFPSKYQLIILFVVAVLLIVTGVYFKSFLSILGFVIAGLAIVWSVMKVLSEKKD